MPIVQRYNNPQKHVFPNEELYIKAMKEGVIKEGDEVIIEDDGEELEELLAAKADLVDGKIPEEQLPDNVKLFVITLSADESGKYTSDKTGQEISDAFDEGRRLVCTVGTNKCIPLSRRNKSSFTNYFVFQSASETEYVTVIIKLHYRTGNISSITVSEGTNSEFIINAILTDEESGECEIDVTAEEFLAAYNAGCTMIMLYDDVRIPLTSAGWLGKYIFEFSLEYRGVSLYKGYGYIIEDEISVFVEVSTNEITIGNQTHYGGEPVDFTDTINTMIDNKTITDEEAASLKIALK